MDIANLQAFVAVAEARSFSEAADRLNLTQPAISKRIAGLESQLAVRLFDRIGRVIDLTESGRILLPRAYQLLSLMGDTRRALTQVAGEIGGSLTLATSHHIGLHRLPPVLRAFTRQYPRVNLDIRFLDSEVAYEEIRHGRVELAVITLAPDVRGNVRAVKVWDDPLDFVAAPDHPLAALGDAVTLTDFAAYPAVMPGTGTFTHHFVQRLFAEIGLRPNISMSTNYLETLKMMVSIGIAWSVLPRSMLDEQMVRLPLAGVSVERQLGYIHHTERTLSNAAHAFMSFLAPSAPEHRTVSR